MQETSGVAAHYARASLLERIEQGLEAVGARIPVNLDMLAPVDEFHIGGRQATERFVGQLGLHAGMRVLDLGCGLGGAARLVGKLTAAHVTGIDLTGDFITAGRALNGMCALIDRVDLVQGSVLDLPFGPDRFDAAYMMHVGMNIADKPRLAAEVARVLKPGCVFGIYDVMRTGTGDLTLPVPWATEPAQNALAMPTAYRAALDAAGFVLEQETDRADFALEFFERMQARQARADGPPPLGLHLVLGPQAPQKVANMIANLQAGLIAPIEMIARLPG
ncbi:class I SAM-dependent methyltransferase [Pukyongiella litopenaei]|uniref:Class I SAM-dependent methyltransferase n=1 Tax=Pukyongiella litopenaei TaxID=2605946 RepID=A0A2S0MSX0_9RHOB|nr:class I SAM-dependent methyltransferase [Pukyongiella litopenaei]AVO38989.1 class I SAM-dependent methyltransferase [Pukyongiella litopenaei]